MPTVSTKHNDVNVEVSSEEITTFSNFTVKRTRHRTPHGDFEDQVKIVQTHSTRGNGTDTQPQEISIPLNKPAPDDVARMVQFIFGAGYRVGLGDAQADIAVN